MKRLLITTLLWGVCVAAIGSHQIEVTIYVDNAYRPFSFADNGQAKEVTTKEDIIDDLEAKERLVKVERLLQRRLTVIYCGSRKNE